MDRGQDNGTANRPNARDVPVDDHLAEVTTKAFREGIPDDTVYWGVIEKQLKQQTGVPNDQPLTRDDNLDTLEANSYPPGTTLQLRKPGAGGPDEVLVDILAAKNQASGLRKDKYEDYKKAGKALYLRHEWFVQGLRGRSSRFMTASGLTIPYVKKGSRSIYRATYRRHANFQYHGSSLRRLLYGLEYLYGCHCQWKKC